MEAQTKVLFVGVAPEMRDLLDTLKTPYDATELPPDLDRLLEPMEPPPGLILCGSNGGAVPLIELGQMLRMQYQDSVIFGTCSDRKNYDRQDFIKNGFNDSFLLPMERATLRSSLEEAIAKMSNSETRIFRAVKLIDIQPGSSLDFDTFLFLPKNNKHIKFSSAGRELSSQRLSRLTESKVNTVKVPLGQMSEFYRYTAEKLRAIGGDSEVSETERAEKMQTAVRGLLSGLFTDPSDASFEKGSGWMRDCQEIVKTYIVGGKSGDWYSRLMEATADKPGTYSHAGNVASLCALFSMALNIGNPEEMAMAGLLHDIGLADVPPEIQSLSEDALTEDEKAVYQRHPELSVNLIKEKKLIMSEKMMKAIFQHHERYNGSGYPKGLTGGKILPEAQVLALADRFDELTTAAGDQQPLSPSEVLDHFQNQLRADIASTIYEPTLLRQVLRLFQPD